MSKRNILKVAMGLALATAATSARAQDSGWYFGITGGQAKADVSRDDFDASVLDSFARAGGPVLSGSSTLEDSDTSLSLVGGYRFSPFLAVEAGYVDLGTFEYRFSGTVNPPGPVLSAPASFSADIEVQGFSVAALGSMPLGKLFDAHLRLGVLFSDTEISQRATVSPFSASDSSSANARDFFYGLGAGLKLGERWSFSLDWQQFKDVGNEDETGESDVDRFSLGVSYRL